MTVVDSRPLPGNRRRRRYKCMSCGRRITTYEIPEKEYMFIERADELEQGIGYIYRKADELKQQVRLLYERKEEDE